MARFASGLMQELQKFRFESPPKLDQINLIYYLLILVRRGWYFQYPPHDGARCLTDC